jgi:hypothetical protein
MLQKYLHYTASWARIEFILRSLEVYVTEEKFVEIVDKKLRQLEGLQNFTYESSEFKVWHNTTKELIALTYGEKSRQYQEFCTHMHISTNIFGTSPQEEAYAYKKGLEQDKATLLALKENVETYGLSETVTESSKDIKRSSITQNFYLNQTQVQAVKNELNIEALDAETKSKLTDLLGELEKPSNKDKAKIRELIKWLADKAIDVLLALITSQNK